MSEYMIQRLQGVIAGICAVRAIETAFATTETVLTTDAETSALLIIALTSGFPAVLYAAFAVAFLTTSRKRWVNYAFLAMEAAFVVFVLYSVRLCFSASDGREEIQRLLVIGAISKVFVSSTMMLCVIVILCEFKPSLNNALEPTPAAATPPAGQG